MLKTMIKSKLKFLSFIVFFLPVVLFSFQPKENLLNLPEKDRLFKAGQIYMEKGLVKDAFEVFAELERKYPNSKYNEQILKYKYLGSYKPKYVTFKYKFFVYLSEKTLIGKKRVPKAFEVKDRVLKNLPEKLEVSLNNFKKKYPTSDIIPEMCYNIARYYFLAENEFPIDITKYFNTIQITGISLRSKWDPIKKEWIKYKNTPIYKLKDYSKLYLDYFVDDIYKNNLKKAFKYYKMIIVNYPESKFWKPSVKELGNVLEIMDKTKNK